MLCPQANEKERQGRNIVDPSCHFPGYGIVDPSRIKTSSALFRAAAVEGLPDGKAFSLILLPSSQVILEIEYRERERDERTDENAERWTIQQTRTND